MIIVAYKPGQLANRVFLFAKFLAYSYEYGVLLINPSFDDYTSYFAKTKKQLIPSSRGWTIFSSRLLIKFFYIICFYFGRALHKLKINFKFLTVTYLDWSEHYDLDTDRRLSTNGFHFIQGWQFESAKLLTKHREAIVHFFQPDMKFSRAIDSFFQDISSASPLVGVHIRHGDYQFFEEGKYFYDIKDYTSVMQQLTKLSQGIKFLICTNNKSISRNDFEELPVVMAPGNELVDLYLLAKCSYIMGPPSTYSVWASFYGNVPLYQIKDVKRDIDWKDFKLVF